MEFKRQKLSACKTTHKEAEKIYKNAVELFKEKGITLASAESCTGGLIGKLFTDVSGASSVFSGGMITYTNHIKIHKLGVSENTVTKYTEVSYECAAEMALRAKEFFESDIGISTTGFAGPGGGNESDPVGTVYLGIATDSEISVFRLSFSSCNRDEIRFGTAKIAAEQAICAFAPKI